MNKESIMSNVLSAFVFWEKNRLQVYERIYDGVFELLSDVGGIYQIIMGVLYFINIIFSEYVQYKDAIYLYEKSMEINTKNGASNLNPNYTKAKSLIPMTDNVNDNNNNNNRSLVIKTTINHNDEENNKKYIDNKKIKLEIVEFLKYLWVNTFGCNSNDKKNEYLKYVEFKKEVLSEEFIYSLYFEKKQNEIEKFMDKKKDDNDNNKKNESYNIEQNTSNIPIQGKVKLFGAKYQNYLM